MSGKILRVVAPSRLHFGLLACGRGSGRHFGGVGVMVERPGVELRVSASEAFSVTGPLNARVRDLVSLWRDWSGLPPPLNCRIDVVSVPSLHMGLGVGTQLALAIARGLTHFFFPRRTVSVGELAQSTGRGTRSAVGTLGFELGGLISEKGKLAGETLSTLDCRVALPAQWRFVLICAPGEGLHGRNEEAAFSELPSIPADVSQRLTQELGASMLPAARSGQFDEFCGSVYRYGYTSGLCFAKVQGGAYNGISAARLVERIRALGTRGVGQSSWGPTLFALAPDQPAAEHLVDQLRSGGDLDGAEVVITSPNNSGARLEWE